MPDDAVIEAFYAGISAKKFVDHDHRLAIVRDAVARYTDRWSRLGVSEGRFADIGGGAGYYARAAADLGFDTSLVDWAGDAMEFATEVLGIESTIAGDIGTVDELLGPASHDVVLARHVIEHLVDPVGFVKALARTVRVGGIVQIETPLGNNREQLAHPGVVLTNRAILAESNPSMSRLRVAREAFRKPMSGVNPPKHLWGFTEQALLMIIERSGLDPVDVSTAPSGDPEFDPLFYEMHRQRATRSFVVEIEQRLTPLFKRRGANLAVVARRVS